MNKTRFLTTVGLLCLTVLNPVYALSWSSLSYEQRQALSVYQKQWNSLSSERQQRLVEGVAKWERLSPSQQDKIKTEFRQFKSMPADKRETLRQRFNDQPALGGSAYDNDHSRSRGDGRPSGSRAFGGRSSRF